MASNNPYGLSSAELNWFHGGASKTASSPDAQQLQASLDAAKARVEVLQGLIATGGTTVQSSLDPQFQTGGTFALSGPEQTWAKGGPANALPLQEQLTHQHTKVHDLERQLRTLLVDTRSTTELN